MRHYRFALLYGALLLAIIAAVSSAQSSRLRIEQVVSDSTSFDVNAVLIIGPTEAILIDAQYHLGDAKRLADRIAATGKRLKAVFLTHPDHDHYMGAATIVERFPGTPVYMTAASIAEYDKTARQQFQAEKSRMPALLPDSVVTPRPLPSTRFTVDGETVEVIPDLQGDVLAPTNSVLWIPSLRTVIASDVVFNGVHPWLGASSPATRTAWKAALQRIADLRPQTVIAGHKPTVDTPDSPAAVQAMIAYLTDFDANLQTAGTPAALIAAMTQKYPWAVQGLLTYAASRALAKQP